MNAFDLSPEAARRALASTGALADGDDDDAVADRYARIVWSHLTEPGDGTAGRLVAELGPASALRAMMQSTPPSLQSLTPADFSAGRRRWMPRLSPDAATSSLRTAALTGVTIVTPADPHWPDQLGDLEEHAPLCLWVRGEAARLSELSSSAALVGARAATSYGEHVAMELAADLAGGGTPIVSGGAYGIDGAAHRAALAVGGLTVAFLAGGADRAYPAGHAQLIGRIADHGVVVSEVPCGSTPTKWRFLQRNRLIAALTAATVVVEAGWRSGAINTAGHAAALSRGLGAVPGPVTSAASAGTHRLLREFGAQCITSATDVRELLAEFGAHCITSATDVRELLGMIDDRRLPFPRAEGGDRPFTDDCTRVRDALSTRVWREADDLARRCGMAVEEVESLLGLLQLAGEVAREAGAWRRIGAS
ncbi:DNA-processing protein DprA [Microbacterium sp. NPDC019599]|uniref:DNA-processing protein DprA n=1 Tax=Microbacterium sp. NPDC019599 TaxID=3154690 RepID=UPI0033C88D03